MTCVTAGTWGGGGGGRVKVGGRGEDEVNVFREMKEMLFVHTRDKSDLKR